MKGPTPPEALLDFLREGSRFIVAGHKEPDGDCVGSQLALTSLLRRMGKEAVACSSGPFKRPEVVPYEARFLKEAPEGYGPEARVLLLDCSAASRAGDLEGALEGFPRAVIDHHASAADPGESSYLDPGAPSVTYLILQLMDALGIEPDVEEAQLLLFGLCTDTGYFRHIDAGRPQALEAGARLVDAGADPKAVFQAMYGGKSLGSRILMGRILSRVESLFEGKLLLSYETQEDTETFGLQGRDSDMLYQLLQSVAGVQAVVLIRQETADNCTVGLRSTAAVDVAAVAARFGGGGHKQAAGLSAPGSIQGLRERLVAVFSEIL